MELRKLKSSDAYQRTSNRYIIVKGSRTIQLTEYELLELQKLVNKNDLLHSVVKSVCTACSGSGRYKDVACGACDGTGED